MARRNFRDPTPIAHERQAARMTGEEAGETFERVAAKAAGRRKRRRIAVHGCDHLEA
jgi:hypothetical protein